MGIFEINLEYRRHLGKKKSNKFVFSALGFHYICSAKIDETNYTVGRLVAVAARQERKVRAAQSTPLPNRKLPVKAE